LVRDGDRIEIDVAARTIHWDVTEAEAAIRKAAWVPPEPRFARGYGKLFSEQVTQANEGCDFRFLHHGPRTPEPDIF
jgi:dihydroxy-acid dehydratase